MAILSFFPIFFPLDFQIEKEELTQTAEELETDLEAAERKVEALQMAMSRMKQDQVQSKLCRSS